MSHPSSRRLPLVVVGFTLLCLVALGLAVVRMRSRDLGAATGANVADAALVGRGRELYMARCASCHGQALEGAPGWPQRDANGLLPAAPLGATSALGQRSDSWIAGVIAGGGQPVASPGTVSAMPAFGGSLSEAEIWALISYIKSTWPAEMRAAQP